jgi:predicted nucleotide-binding protein
MWMSQVFISHSRKDQAFVQRLAADLAARLPQVQVFYDMLIQPGASWADTLAAQIEQADVVLALLSPDYLASAWAQQELNVALERQPTK